MNFSTLQHRTTDGPQLAAARTRRATGALAGFLLLAAGSFTAAHPALAQDSGPAANSVSPNPAITLHLDPSATEIQFSSGSALHRVKGTFKLKGGSIAFDPKTGVAQGQILVDADSAESADKKTEAKMKSDVIESQKYPEIFFHAEKSVGTVKRGSDQQLTLIGSFNMHGTDHPMKVIVDVAAKEDDTAVAKTEFDVPYVEWGMKSASTMLMHDKTVHISMVSHVTIEGLKKDTETGVGARPRTNE